MSEPEKVLLAVILDGTEGHSAAIAKAHQIAFKKLASMNATPVPWPNGTSARVDRADWSDKGEVEPLRMKFATEIFIDPDNVFIYKTYVKRLQEEVSV